MGGLTGSGVTGASVTAALVTKDRVTGPGSVTPVIVDAISISFYVQCDFQQNPESISGGLRLDVRWSPDGTRVITARDSSNRFDAYDVSPAFSIAPATWINRTNTSFGDPRWIWWKPDGLRLFAQAGNGLLQQFDTVTPFDITSLVAAGSIFNSTGKLDGYMSVDGFTLWIYSTSSPTNTISELALSTAFDITSLNLTATQTKSLAADISSLRSFTFSDDGLFLYMITSTGSPGTLASYPLSVPFDISTAGAFVLGVVIGDVATMSIPRALNYSSVDGSLYVFGDQGVGGQRVKRFCPTPDPDIDAYTLTTADIPFTIAGNNHLTPIFNIAGDRVYFSRSTSVETWQYSMSPAGNLASLSFELTHDWGTTQFQRGLTLNKDRSKAYKIRTASSSGDSFVSADPFSVTEMGDVSGGNPYTMTGVSALAAIGTPTSPVSFVVTPDDVNLFVQSIDPGDRAIYHYLMSVAGDAGTATSQGQALDASSEFATRLLGIIYTPDGSKLFVLGDDGGTLKVAQYDMSVAYDVNTAVYSGKQITVTPLSETLLSLFVWANPAGGFKLYLTWPTGGASNGSSWRYDLYDAP